MLHGTQGAIKYGDSDIESSAYYWQADTFHRVHRTTPFGWVLERGSTGPMYDIRGTLRLWGTEQTAICPRSPVDIELISEASTAAFAGKVLLSRLTLFADSISGAPQTADYDFVGTTDDDGTGGVAIDGTPTTVEPASITILSGDDASVSVSGPTIQTTASGVRHRVVIEREAFETPVFNRDRMTRRARAALKVTGQLDILQGTGPELVDSTQATIVHTMTSGQTYTFKAKLFQSGTVADARSDGAQIMRYRYISHPTLSTDTVA